MTKGRPVAAWAQTHREGMTARGQEAFLGGDRDALYFYYGDDVTGVYHCHAAWSARLPSAQQPTQKARISRGKVPGLQRNAQGASLLPGPGEATLRIF